MKWGRYRAEQYSSITGRIPLQNGRNEPNTDVYPFDIETAEQLRCYSAYFSVWLRLFGYCIWLKRRGQTYWIHCVTVRVSVRPFVFVFCVRPLIAQYQSVWPYSLRFSRNSPLFICLFVRVCKGYSRQRSISNLLSIWNMLCLEMSFSFCGDGFRVRKICRVASEKQCHTVVAAIAPLRSRTNHII